MMTDIAVGMLAVSLAGHDKGAVYVITGITEERILVSDGRLHPVDRPKKKNPGHLQVIKNRRHEGPAGDTEIKRTIKLYQMEIRKSM